MDDSLGVLYLTWQWVKVVLSVKVEVYAMIPKGLHVCLTARCRVTLRIWWSHICGIFTDDISQCALILAHLLHALVRRYVLETVVGPGMGCDLVALGDHPLDDGWVRRRGVNWAFANVVTCDKERSMETVCFQGVEELASVEIWTVVVG